MKKINISKFAAIALIAVGTVFATGCSKETGEEAVMPGEGTRVVISVGGINEGNSGSFNKIQASAGKSSANAASNDGLIEGNGFDVFITRPSGSLSHLGFKDKIRAAASGTDALKAETPMPSGNTYRVFLRKQGETVLTSAALKSGTPGSISVEKGATYEWFALSFNNTTEVPDPASGTDVALPAIDGLLYSKGEFSVGTGEGDVVVPLAIVFKPRVTKAVIEINTMGMFASIDSIGNVPTISVTGLYNEPEAIDVLTGNLTGDNVTPKPIDFSDFEQIPGFEGQRWVAEAFVAGNATEDITVTVSNLSINLDNNTIRNFGTTPLKQTFAPEAGMQQNIVLNFIESPLSYGLVNSDTVKWSRSNLYYSTATLASNPYRFNHVNDYDATIDPDSYFSFHGHLPRRLGSAVESQQKDPCALVYPAGLWKTPNRAEMATVTSRSGVLGNLLGSIGDLIGIGGTPGAVAEANYIEYTPLKGVNTKYGSATSSNNKLRFNYNGIQTNVGLVEGLITLNLANSKGSSVGFWTNEQGVNLLGLVGVGSWNYFGYTNKGLLGLSKNPVGSAAASLLDIDLVGLNVLSSALMNVRCVRDASWDTAKDAANYNPYPDLTNL